VKITIVGDFEVCAKFEKAPAEIREALKRGVQRATLAVLKRSKEKLSDDVLRVRTGRLRRSITSKVEDQGGSIVGSVGTVVQYGRVHEFGFNGTVTVRDHLRRAKSGKEINVRAHSRKVNLPERSFLRSALREIEPEIAGLIETEINKKLRQL